MPVIRKVRGALKTLLLDGGGRLERSGHPHLARLLDAPVRAVRAIRAQTDGPRRRLRRLALIARGRWIPFLRPAWEADEFHIGRTWQPGASDDAVRALEARCVAAFEPGGVAVATSSGRTALRLALRVLQRREPERDEVVIPSYTCPAVLLPVIECGLKPVFADIEEDSLNATADTLASHIGSRTLAVVPIHLGGRYMDSIDALIDAAARAGVAVIEDVCQATGGSDARGPWGARADFALHSFGIGKLAVGTAGGMLLARRPDPGLEEEAARLTTEDPDLVRTRFAHMRRVFFPSFAGRVLPDPSRPVEAFHAAYGDCAMASLDARLVARQLDRLERILALRAQNAGVLVEAVEGLDALRIAGAGNPNTWTKCTAVVRDEAAARRILAELHELGIETEAMYTPLHLRPEGQPFHTHPLPVTESVWRRVFCLPVRPCLRPEQMRYIGRVLRCAVEAVERGGL